MYAGRYLTAKISEFPSHEIECSLSAILEDNVPEKYYLSRKQAEKLLYNEKPTQGERIYSSKGLSCTLTSGSGGFGGHSGLYLIEDTENFGLPIKSKTKDGYQIAYPGDSIDTAFSGQNSRRSRVGSQVAHTLTTSATQAYYFIDLNPDPKLTEIARCITARHDSGISNRKAEHSGMFVENSDVLDNNEKFAVAFVDPNGEVHIGSYFAKYKSILEDTQKEQMFEILFGVNLSKVGKNGVLNGSNLNNEISNSGFSNANGTDLNATLMSLNLSKIKPLNKVDVKA